MGFFGLMGFLFWVFGGVLVVAAGLRLRKRLAKGSGPTVGPLIDDEAVGRIVEEGVLEDDDEEPLDHDEIGDEERRFWEEEEWDDAEEW